MLCQSSSVFVVLCDAFGFFGFWQSEGSCWVCSAKAWAAAYMKYERPHSNWMDETIADDIAVIWWSNTWYATMIYNVIIMSTARKIIVHHLHNTKRMWSLTLLPRCLKSAQLTSHSRQPLFEHMTLTHSDKGSITNLQNNGLAATASKCYESA